MKCETVAASMVAMSDSHAPETCKQFLEKKKMKKKGEGTNDVMQARRHTDLTAEPTFLEERLLPEKSQYLNLATCKK